MKRFLALVALLALPAAAQVVRPGDQHWRAPVANAAALPSTGNALGDTRKTLDDLVEYTWGGASWVAGSGATGTVTSVGISLPAWLTASGSPVTSSGTLAVSPASGQTSHRVIGTCGSATAFAPCALIAADLPALPYLADSTAYAGSVSTGGPATTATALAADGSDCSGGSYARGVDALGNATGCTAASAGSLAGPVSSTDHSIATWDGTGGSTLADNPGVTIPSSGVLQAPEIRGSAASGGSLVIRSTSDATTGVVCFEGTSSAFPGFKIINLSGMPALRVVTCPFSAGGGIIANLFASPDDTNPLWAIDSGTTAFWSGGQIRWRDGGNALIGTIDTSIMRGAAGIVKFGSTFQLQDPGTRPTCDVSLRGVHWFDAGGAGVADSEAVCAKDASDVYGWRDIF